MWVGGIHGRTNPTNQMITVVYASRATQAMDRPALAELLNLARARNATDQVTGMLLYAYDSYVQQVEGEPGAVERLLGRIARDPRHTDVRVLSRRDITQRRYGAWAMGVVHPYASTPADPLGEQPGMTYPLVTGELVDNGELAENLLGLFASRMPAQLAER
jgi:hypothetical protein